MITLSAAAIIVVFAFALGLIVGTYRKNKKRFEAMMPPADRDAGIIENLPYYQYWLNEIETQNNKTA